MKDEHRIRTLGREPEQIGADKQEMEVNAIRWDAMQHGVNQFEQDFALAFEDRVKGLVVTHHEHRAEHPTARLLRVGIESVRAGVPSEAFLELLELVALASNEFDILPALAPGTFRPVDPRTMETAQEQYEIAQKFRAYLREYQHRKQGRTQDFTEAKASFVNDQWQSPSVIARALEKHGLDSPARPGRKKK